MIKNRKFLGLIFFTLLLSCGEGDSEIVESTPIETTTLDTTSNVDLDTAEVIEEKVQIDVTTLLRKLNNDTVYQLPFTLDSNYMESIGEENEILTNLEVQYLSSDLINNQITEWSSYDIKSFIDIDSMRLMGTYEEYVDNIDIGMMQESDAYLLHKISVDANSFILLWSISYSTYEACPYASGTVVFGTYFNNNMALNTAVLGEDSGGGDAPYWGSTFITSQITSDHILTNKHEESGGDMDEETGEDIVDVIDKEFEVKLSQLGFEAIKKD